jgi:hypothetical protein
MQQMFLKMTFTVCSTFSLFTGRSYLLPARGGQLYLPEIHRCGQQTQVQLTPRSINREEDR